MAKWHLTNRAVSDLDSIWEYTANVWSEQQADLYYGELIAEIGHIANNKFLVDREYSEVKKGCFAIIIENISFSTKKKIMEMCW